MARSTSRSPRASRGCSARRSRSPSRASERRRRRSPSSSSSSSGSYRRRRRSSTPRRERRSGRSVSPAHSGRGFGVFDRRPAHQEVSDRPPSGLPSGPLNHGGPSALDASSPLLAQVLEQQQQMRQLFEQQQQQFLLQQKHFASFMQQQQQPSLVASGSGPSVRRG